MANCSEKLLPCGKESLAPMGNELDTIRNRKPARSSSEIPLDVLQALSAGSVPSLSLTEWCAADRQKLLESVLIQLPIEGLASNEIWTESLLKQSALKQSFAIGNWIANYLKVGDDSWRVLSAHPSDMVREWAAIVVGCTPGLTFPRRLAWMKLFADDEHSGVREIAWMALRSEVVQNTADTIKSLVPWTGSRNERLRRFASEITRPRGVWCEHIPILKEIPQLGLPIVEPLLADESKYVQKSVGNWLNDACKSQPGWARELSNRWLEKSASVHTRAIFKRGLRSLSK